MDAVLVVITNHRIHLYKARLDSKGGTISKCHVGSTKYTKELMKFLISLARKARKPLKIVRSAFADISGVPGQCGL